MMDILNISFCCSIFSVNLLNCYSVWKMMYWLGCVNYHNCFHSRPPTSTYINLFVLFSSICMTSCLKRHLHSHIRNFLFSVVCEYGLMSINCGTRLSCLNSALADACTEMMQVYIMFSVSPAVCCKSQWPLTIRANTFQTVHDDDNHHWFLRLFFLFVFAPVLGTMT